MSVAAVPRHRAGRGGPSLRLLRHRDLRLLLTAFVLGACGSWAATVLLAAWLFERTGSLTWLAALAAARWIPGAVAAPLAGTLVDRVSRRSALVGSAALSSAAAVAIACAVAAAAAPAVVLALVAAAALAAAPARPAAGAIVPDLVAGAELPAASALMAAAENLVVVVGPAAGAALLLADAGPAGLAAPAAGFLAAALIAARIGAASHGGCRTRPLAHLGAAAAALRAAPTAPVLVAFCAVDTLLAWSYGVIYPPLARHLALGPAGYGQLLTAAAVGGVVGAALAPRLDALRRPVPVLLGAVLLQSLPYAATAWTTDPLVGTGLQAVSGAGMVVVEVVTLLGLQREVPAACLGGALALFETSTLLTSAVGGALSSAVLSAVPVTTALVVLGGGDALLALALLPLLLRACGRAPAPAHRRAVPRTRPSLPPVGGVAA